MDTRGFIGRLVGLCALVLSVLVETLQDTPREDLWGKPGARPSDPMSYADADRYEQAIWGFVPVRSAPNYD
jgi:hypothetical protein